MLVARPLRMALGAMVFFQALHVGEHMVQATQHIALGQPHPHGFLGDRLDVEWLHFAVNGMLWAGILGSFVLMARRPEFWSGIGAFPRGAFAAAAAVETYHLVEHVVRIRHLLVSGQADPRGILGQVTDGILLHLGLNAVVLLLILPLTLALLRAPRPLAPLGAPAAARPQRRPSPPPIPVARRGTTAK